ncbi:MAG: hypothetical protein JRI48_08405 [Deltaproteobacteria bacterium]|nr:hypothetical protein [Deltaproteobacteria bacterium]
MSIESKKLDFSNLIEAWPSPLVAREKVGEFSGFILNARTLANYDSRGTGPKGRIKIGRKVCYPATELVEWMRKRARAL